MIGPLGFGRGVGDKEAFLVAVCVADDAGSSGVPNEVGLLVDPEVAVLPEGVIDADADLGEDLAVKADGDLIEAGWRQVEFLGETLGALAPLAADFIKPGGGGIPSAEHRGLGGIGVVGDAGVAQVVVSSVVDLDESGVVVQKVIHKGQTGSKTNQRLDAGTGHVEQVAGVDAQAGHDGEPLAGRKTVLDEHTGVEGCGLGEVTSAGSEAVFGRKAVLEDLDLVATAVGAGITWIAGQASDGIEVAATSGDADAVVVLHVGQLEAGFEVVGAAESFSGVKKGGGKLDVPFALLFPGAAAVSVHKVVGGSVGGLQDVGLGEAIGNAVDFAEGVLGEVLVGNTSLQLEQEFVGEQRIDKESDPMSAALNPAFGLGGEGVGVHAAQGRRRGSIQNVVEIGAVGQGDAGRFVGLPSELDAAQIEDLVLVAVVRGRNAVPGLLTDGVGDAVEAGLETGPKPQTVLDDGAAEVHGPGVVRPIGNGAIVIQKDGVLNGRAVGIAGEGGHKRGLDDRGCVEDKLVASRARDHVLDKTE